MLRNILCILGAIFGLMTIATSQEGTSTIDTQASETQLGDMILADGAALSPTPPKYCNPCIFYSGDFNPKNTLANGLFNGMFDKQDGEVWVPFRIKATVVVKGLFINELFNAKPPQTTRARWAIKKGVSRGNAGQVVCSGINNATAKSTGREFVFMGVTYREFTYLITLPESSYCTIVNANEQDNQTGAGHAPPGMGQCPGVCAMSIEPMVSSDDSPAKAIRGFLSDVEDNPPHHHFGLQNFNKHSFFSSTTFGIDYQPTWGNTGVCATTQLSITGVGCDMFSVGLIGEGR